MIDLILFEEPNYFQKKVCFSTDTYLQIELLEKIIKEKLNYFILRRKMTHGSAFQMYGRNKINLWKEKHSIFDNYQFPSTQSKTAKLALQS